MRDIELIPAPGETYDQCYNRTMTELLKEDPALSFSFSIGRSESEEILKPGRKRCSISEDLAPSCSYKLRPKIMKEGTDMGLNKKKPNPKPDRVEEETEDDLGLDADDLDLDDVDVDFDDEAEEEDEEPAPKKSSAKGKGKPTKEEPPAKKGKGKKGKGDLDLDNLEIDEIDEDDIDAGPELKVKDLKGNQSINPSILPAILDRLDSVSEKFATSLSEVASRFGIGFANVEKAIKALGDRVSKLEVGSAPAVEEDEEEEKPAKKPAKGKGKKQPEPEPEEAEEEEDGEYELDTIKRLLGVINKQSKSLNRGALCENLAGKFGCEASDISDALTHIGFNPKEKMVTPGKITFEAYVAAQKKAAKRGK